MADCVAECHSTTLDLSESLFTPCLVVLKPYSLLSPPPRALVPGKGCQGLYIGRREIYFPFLAFIGQNRDFENELGTLGAQGCWSGHSLKDQRLRQYSTP